MPNNKCGMEREREKKNKNNKNTGEKKGEKSGRNDSKHATVPPHPLSSNISAGSVPFRPLSQKFLYSQEWKKSYGGRKGELRPAPNNTRMICTILRVCVCIDRYETNGRKPYAPTRATRPFVFQRSLRVCRCTLYGALVY